MGDRPGCSQSGFPPLRLPVARSLSSGVNAGAITSSECSVGPKMSVPACPRYRLIDRCKLPSVTGHFAKTQAMNSACVAKPNPFFPLVFTLEQHDVLVGYRRSLLPVLGVMF